MLDPASKARLTEAVKLVWSSISVAEGETDDPWQFAIQVDELYRKGLTDAELRWLMLRGYVRHLQETTRRGDRQRTFDATPQLFLGPRSSFVVGAEIALDEALQQINGMSQGNSKNDRCPAAEAESNSRSSNGERPSRTQPRPSWNPVRRELRVGESLVKVFKWRAPNQELVLTVFEEEAWPDKILDPLPVHQDMCQGRRLNDTIKCLNKRQTSRLIRFRGDGTGQGVVWELLPETQDQILSARVRSPSASPDLP